MRIGLCVSSSAFFVAGFPIMIHFVSEGGIFGAFMIIPLTLIAWSFGQRVGIVAAVAGIAFTEVIMNTEYLLIRHSSEPSYWVLIAVAPALVFLFVGFVAGKLGDALGELKRSHAHLDAVMNALPDILYEVDREGVIYDFRSRPELLLVPHEISRIGRNVVDVLPAEAARTSMAAVASACESGLHKSPTVAFTNNGKTRWYELSIAAVGDHREKDCHFVVLARDVSERSRLEQQLIQSQKMEAIGRLSGGIAHDFNNILMVITSYCDLLQQTPGDKELVQEAVPIVKSSAEKAASLTRQLLAFSRKQVFTPSVVDVDKLVNDSWAMLSKLLGENIIFSHESRGSGNCVKADPSQLQQVIMNLTVNARDAMAEGGTLTIGVQSVEIRTDDSLRPPEMVPGNYVQIEVSDTGSGMDLETLSHLFEPFFTTKALGRGTGLGLSIIYGIVKQSEGYIYVDSKLGSGTKFRVYLRRVQGVGEEEPIHSPDEEQKGTETILVVEDEEEVRRLIQKQLTECGYDVLEASNGQEALNICGKGARVIHLLITDIGLPGLSGWKVAEGFRQSNPNGHVIFITAYADSVGLAGLERIPKAELVQKPFKILELQARIRRVLDSPQR